MDIEEALRAVIAQRGTTTIIYHGGSAPGTARAIAPIAVQGDTLVARCLETKARKTFKLAKVEIVGGEAITPYPHRVLDDVDQLKALSRFSLSEFCESVRPVATAQGWVLTVVDRRIEAMRGVERHILAFEPTLSGAYFDDDGRRFEIESERPWHVDGRLFTHKERAFAAFVDALLGDA